MKRAILAVCAGAMVFLAGCDSQGRAMWDANYNKPGMAGGKCTHMGCNASCCSKDAAGTMTCATGACTK